MPDPRGGQEGFQVVVSRGKKQLALESERASIEIGTRSSCSITLDDPIAGERHCAIHLRPEGFALEDLGSAIGTYLNGVPVQRLAPLHEGDVIVVGASRLRVTGIGEDRGRPVLELALEEVSFFFKFRDKKEFKRDPDEWVRSEVLFGRSKALRVGNWIAVVSILILGPLVVWTSVGEALLEPGGLHTAHAREAAERGCEMCHTPFRDTPVDKCEQCHSDVTQPRRHPFAEGRELAFARGFSDCAECHSEHHDGPLLTPPAEGTCIHCHAEAQLDPASMLTDLAGRGERLSDQERASHPVPVRYDQFSHASHLRAELGIACGECHASNGEEDPHGREFAPVAFELCMSCHDAGRSDQDRWEGIGEHLYTVAWHGAGDGSNCTRCHTAVHEGALRQTETTVVEQLAYRVRRRSHREHFEASLGTNRCAECHISDSLLQQEGEYESVFWHGLHLADLFPSSPEEQRDISRTCLECHAEVRASSSLGALAVGGEHYAGPALDRCADCHVDADEAPLLAGLAAEQRLGARRIRDDFPHEYHVGGKVEGECFACHSFQRGETPFDATTQTIDKACASCHANHENIGGGACGECHGFEDRWREGPENDPWRFSVWRNDLRTKAWPAARGEAGGGFSHFSQGHQALSERGACSECHEPTELAGAASVFDVPIPDETQPLCRQCHVLDRQRFHWE